MDDEELKHSMKVIKGVLENIPKWELIKIIMFFYFSKPENIQDILDIWVRGNKHTTDVMNKYLGEGEYNVL